MQFTAYSLLHESHTIPLSNRQTSDGKFLSGCSAVRNVNSSHLSQALSLSIYGFAASARSMHNIANFLL